MPVNGQRALTRALAQIFEAEGATAALESAASRPWASATFSGSRHRIGLRLTGPGAERAADAVLPGLAEREFALPRHILIDIARESVTRTVDGVLLALEALTIEAD